MSTYIATVVCPGCGFSNEIWPSNTVVDLTIVRPELSHLQVKCGWCDKVIPTWTTQEVMTLAKERGCRVDLWCFVRDWVVEKFAEIRWVHPLGPDQEAAIASLRDQLDAWSGESEEDSPPIGLPQTWTCECGTTGCMPVRIAVGEKPLRVT